MFGGTYIHSLDSAGRFVMPLNFRTSLGPDFYITKGVGCVYVFNDVYAAEVEKQLQAMGSALQVWLNPDIARLHRHFYSDMIRTKTDSQNRLLLPPEHRKYSGVQDEVVICGCGQYIELWAPDRLESYRAENEDIDKLISSGKLLLGPAKGVADGGISSAGVGE